MSDNLINSCPRCWITHFLRSQSARCNRNTMVFRRSCSNKSSKDDACCNTVITSDGCFCLFPPFSCSLSLRFRSARYTISGSWPTWTLPGTYCSLSRFIRRLTAWWYSPGNRISSNWDRCGPFGPFTCIPCRLGCRSDNYITRWLDLTLWINMAIWIKFKAKIKRSGGKIIRARVGQPNVRLNRRVFGGWWEGEC